MFAGGAGPEVVFFCLNTFLLSVTLLLQCVECNSCKGCN